MRRKKNADPKKEIYINSTMGETRVAISEDGQLVELYVELSETERMVGDIYLGRVVNVVRGMKAAFVDIGQEQDAFLHFSDIGQTLDEYGAFLDLEAATANQNRSSRRPVPREGQEILVQIIKEPISTKGSRITSELSIAGRFFVLVPHSDMIGVSRKIANLKERRRLKQIARDFRPPGFGIIIRTVAEHRPDELLVADLKSLLDTWSQIEKKLKTLRPPSLVHKDLGMTSSVIRDLFTNDVSRVIVDTPKQHKEISKYLKDFAPDMKRRIELYKGAQPIFDAYGIEQEIEKSLSRKVWTKLGCYLIFDHTEALVAIDVNSGKFMGRGRHDENSLKVNLEAGKEIARQLRLRDIGGIIVIDFIDMVDPKNRKTLHDAFLRELSKDRAQVNITPISEFGLIEMTRERIRPSLMFTYSETCPTCEGLGRISSKITLLTRIERAVNRLRAATDVRTVQLEVHPDIATFLTNGLRSPVRRMMWKYWVKVEVRSNEELRHDEFRFISRKTGEELNLN